MIVNSNMHAIEVAFVQKGLLFTCETMGERFSTTKLAVGPEELNEYHIFFSIHSVEEVGEKLTDYLFFEGKKLKLDRQRIERQKKKVIFERQLEML